MTCPIAHLRLEGDPEEHTCSTPSLASFSAAPDSHSVSHGVDTGLVPHASFVAPLLPEDVPQLTLSPCKVLGFLTLFFF